MERTKEAASLPKYCLNIPYDSIWWAKNFNKKTREEELRKLYYESLKRTHKEYREQIKTLKIFIRNYLSVPLHQEEKLINKINDLFGGI
jgi:hypothetical protein